jgi:phosphate transport system substrate-binding protein
MSLWRKARFFIFLCPLLALSGRVEADVEISGSSTVLPIVKKASKALEAHYGVKLNVHGGGSGAGINAVSSGTADIGMVSRAMNPEETRKFQVTTIGYDGIAFIVHTKNQLSGLTRDQARAIFSGEATNWKDFTGLNRPILPIDKDKGRSTRDLTDEFLGLSNQIPDKAMLAGSNTEVILRVASDPLAIGYVSIGSGEKVHLKGLPIKLMPLDGVVASAYELLNGAYPFSRELNLITNFTPTPLIEQVIQFFTSPEGQEFVEAEGFIPLPSKAQNK